MRTLKRTNGEDPNQIPLILHRAAQVCTRIRRLGGQLRCPPDYLRLEFLAAKELFGLTCLDRRRVL